MNRLGITGHQNLSLEISQFVTAQIKTLLVKHNELVGITSLAAGADQLFAHLVLAQGGMIEVIVPSQNYEETFSNNDELLQYNSLLLQAKTVTNLPFVEPSEDAYMAAGEEVVRQSDALIAIWDGQPARGKGGTSDVVQFARSNGVPVFVIWPEGATRD